MAATIEVTPNFAIGYYLVALIGYLVYKTVNIPTTGGSNQQIGSTLILGAIAAVILVGEYMISVGMTKTVCGFEQWDVAAIYTFIPWILIVGAVKGIITVRPGWLVPFSNTLGYFVSSAAFGLTESFRQVLKPKVSLTKDGKEDQQEEAGKSAYSRDVAKALQEIYEDESLLINQLTPDNVDATIEKFSGVGLMYTPKEYANAPENIGNPGAASVYLKYVEAIKKAVWFKLIFAEFVWLFLAGVLAISVTYNYIINFGCKMTPEQIAERKAKLSAISSANAEAKKDAVPSTSVITE